MINSQRFFFFGYFYFLGSRRMVVFVGFLTGGFCIVVFLSPVFLMRCFFILRDLLGLLVFSLLN